MSEPPVEVTAPDIRPYRQGNTGIPYVTTFESGRAGPHAVITALVHGNELSGALALVELFERGIRPERGRLSLAFVNTDAYERFDPEQPKASRYLDEDLNRVWDRATLDGPRRSAELDRARALRPLIERADVLLDLHSMQLPAPPLLLCGLAAKGRRLARAIGYPGLVVADAGHRSGARMRDFGAFADPASPRVAMLVECGQHWAAPASRSRSPPASASSRRWIWSPPRRSAGSAPPPPEPQRLIEVTHAVTVERRAVPFTEDFQGLEVVAQAGHRDRP